MTPDDVPVDIMDWWAEIRALQGLNIYEWSDREMTYSDAFWS